MSGVSLVEIMIAVVILGIAIIPIWVLFLHSSDTVQVGQQENTIITIASSFAAQVQNLDAGIGPTPNGKVQIPFSPDGSYQLGGAAENRITLPPWDPNTFSLAYEVDETITLPGQHKLYFFYATWKGRLGGTREFSLPIVVFNEPK